MALCRLSLVIWSPVHRRIVELRPLSRASDQYLRHGVLIVVCCLFDSNFAQTLQTDLREIFREGWHRANEQMLKFR